MPTLKVIAEVDDQHRLMATVPDSVAPGQVEVLLVVPRREEDDAGAAWLAGVAQEWQQELSDPREDIYSLSDGADVGGMSHTG